MAETGILTTEDTLTLPPHEHQWVLGIAPRKEMMLATPCRWRLVWACQCGKAKVVEYEV